MKGGTFFSGIDAPEVSAPAINWQWRAEIDRFANAVSEFHRPGIPNLGDMMEADFDGAEPVDFIVFGSPCQDFSVAGKRLGLDGARGNLALVALAAIARIKPRWFVFENVPGLLSNWSGAEGSDLEPGQRRDAIENSDFAAFLGAVRECGYLGCWRVLDAQFAGVPQRRRRPFFVGYLGDWRPAAAVLFERESLQGHPAPGREAGEDIARCVATGTNSQCCDGESETFVPVTHSLRAEGFDASEDGTGRGTPLVACETTGFQGDDVYSHDAPAWTTLPAGGGNNGGGGGAILMQPAAFDWQSGGDSRGLDPQPTAQLQRCQTPAVAYAINSHAGAADGDQTNRSHASGGPVGLGVSKGTAYSLRGGRTQAVSSAMSVRRLTPRECERLQGFPDNHTRVPWRGKPADQCPDGPRYKALGNSMAVPVIGWILDRVQKVNAIMQTNQESVA